MLQVETHKVPEDAHPQRLSDYAIGLFNTLPSRKSLKKAIKRGEILVNGEVAGTGHWVQAGETLTLIDLETNPPKDYDLQLEVVYEDEYLAVIKKPAGIVVSGNQFRTIYNALGGNLQPSQQEDALRWPRPVHRLDQPTSGLLLVAKTATALIKLGQLFEHRNILKQYQAVVMGRLPEKLLIDQPLDGQNATTEVVSKEIVPSLKNEWLTLVDLFPKTGRTHQLRKHLAGMGTPILGDPLYGKEGLILKGKGLFLCAIGLRFLHPIQEIEMDIRIPTPTKFDSLLQREARRWAKYNMD